MTYPEAIQYLESLINYEKIPAYPYKESLKLERIKGFLGRIDNPQNALRCIHIAGTKGKGSTCAFITYILREAGYKVGLYTSPHLSDFRERIRILQAQRRAPRTQVDFEGMISKRELAGLVGRLRPAIEKYNKNQKYGPLSFFEVYTALAFVYFKEKKVDLAVLETGLGGKLDATNVVDPLVCAITPISYEHTQQLGNTLREIATEKAGIIKTRSAKAGKAQNLLVITAPQEQETIEVIRTRCRKAGAKLYEVGGDITYRKIKEIFEVKGIFDKYSGLKINLLGEHQLINATVAVATVEALSFFNINLSVDSLREGLYNTAWPGRCEIISRNPLVVLDGAQNIASSRALREAIKGNFKYKRLILVLGISKDKDIQGICQQLYPLADKFILTQAGNPRAASVDIIEQVIRGQEQRRKKQVLKTKNIQEARKLASRMSDQEDLILVCGSLFVVGEFRDALA